MGGIVRKISKKNMRGKEERRLDELRETKFLTHRVFMRISENMSYEIFKFVDSIDLLQIRCISLGGYQLISNPILRARIKNYLKDKPIAYVNDLLIHINKTMLLFEQKGERVLSFRSLYNFQIKELSENLQFIHLQTLNLSKFTYFLQRKSLN